MSSTTHVQQLSQDVSQTWPVNPLPPRTRHTNMARQLWQDAARQTHSSTPASASVALEPAPHIRCDCPKQPPARQGLANHRPPTRPPTTLCSKHSLYRHHSPPKPTPHLYTRPAQKQQLQAQADPRNPEHQLRVGGVPGYSSQHATGIPASADKCHYARHTHQPLASQLTCCSTHEQNAHPACSL